MKIIRSLLVLLIISLGSACSDTHDDSAPVCAKDSCNFELGALKLTAQRDGETWELSLAHGEQIVWASVTGHSLVTARKGQQNVEFTRGSFVFKEQELPIVCSQSRIKKITTQGNSVLIRGGFADCDDTLFTLTLSPVSSRRVDFDLQLLDGQNKPHGDLNRIALTYASTVDEHFFGFGAQYSYLDMKGRKLPIWCQEQGHGRGAQPITQMLSAVSGGSAGDWHTTYTAVPYYLTSLNRGMFIDNLEYLTFDMTESDRVEVETYSTSMRGSMMRGENLLEIIETYTEIIGRMEPLPEWVHNGAAVRSFNGGLESVLDQIQEIKENDIAVSALFLEDWAGTRITPFGIRMLWNWSVDTDQYPDYPGLISKLADQGIRLLAYFNPYLADPAGVKDVARNLYEEAEKLDYLVKKPNGTTYPVEFGGYFAAIVDLTNPEARSWLKQIIKDQIANGISGWMADFGEALPPDAVLHSGVDAMAYHNQYVLDWAKLNREAAEESGRFDDIVFFSRGGIARSPGISRLFWLGDQITTWDEFDGIKTVIPALLSAGLSGFALEHPDTGGWLSVEVGAASFRRTREMFQRWVELSTFTSWLRIITTNLPEENHQYNSDAETLSHFSRFTRIFRALSAYRKQLMVEAYEKGYPVARHLILHYPDDPEVYALRQQFLFGSELLVAPVVDEGASEVEVYFPRGQWVHVWSGEIHGSENEGRWQTISAPIGQPAVFHKLGSAAGEAFVQRMQEEDLL